MFTARRARLRRMGAATVIGESQHRRKHRNLGVRTVNQCSSVSSVVRFFANCHLLF